MAEAQVEVDGLRMRGRIKPSSHSNNPPGPRVKEKKVAVTFGPGGAGKVYGLVTEAKDIIECFWWNLPMNVRAKRRGQHRTGPNMLDDIYQNWDRLNLSEVVKCLALNEITDRGIGRANQAGLRDWRKNLPDGVRPPRSPAFGMGPYRQALFNNYPRF